MDERRLRYFLAVIDEGSVTRAAAKLHIAQPSLSQALRALETELSIALFHRVGRGLRPTAAGWALIGPARQALRAIDGVRNAASEVAGLLAGSLEIAALSTLAVDPLAQLIGRFRHAYPQVSVQVRESEGIAAVSAMVRDGTCELGVGHLPLLEDDLQTSELGTQELVLVAPAESELPGDGAITPRSLRDIPLVLSPPGTSTRMLLEQALETVEVTPRIAVEVSAREAIIPLVLAGAGAALLPSSLARQAELRGAQVRPMRPRIVRNIGLTRRREQLSPAARAFVALVDA